MNTEYYDRNVSELAMAAMNVAWARYAAHGFPGLRRKTHAASIRICSFMRPVARSEADDEVIQSRALKARSLSPVDAQASINFFKDKSGVSSLEELTSFIAVGELLC